MTWADFYLVCFVLGFAFSFFSFLLGGLHWHPPHGLGGGHMHAGPHVHVGHGAGGHGVANGVDFSFFNPETAAAFLACGLLVPTTPSQQSVMLRPGSSARTIATDLRNAGVAIFTMGQYLAPTERHHPVRRYYTPEEFAELGKQALHLGFQHVESAPLVRSSYMAHRALHR